MKTPPLETLRWVGGPDGHLLLLDQTRLPLECAQVACRDVAAVFHAIQTLQVRGAPAIGIAAAYGVVLGLQPSGDWQADHRDQRLQDVMARLAASRPTAVNLFWALERMRRRADALSSVPLATLQAELLAEAQTLHDEDRAVCRAIGKHGAELVPAGAGILTHCNAGWLAASEYGTALAVVYTAQDQGKQVQVYADETRPLLQGARLTTWELLQRGVPVTLICDSMAAQVMREGRVQLVITGADRIAANGDTANKIGTYGLALLARAHRIPFYVAAPRSTFDRSLADGAAIPIEQRAAEEITCGLGRQVAPAGVPVYNPAFDVTPADLITALVCEHGIIRPVNRERIAARLGV